MDFFETLGIKPALGRSFLPGEEQYGKSDVAILSDSLWRSRFGADPQILGKVLTIDKRPTTVVGVMPASYDFPSGAQIWLPFPFGAEEANVRRFHYLRPILRLKPGVTPQMAAAELNTIAESLEKAYPDSNATWRVRLEPLSEVMVGNVREPLTILLGAVGLVLLIACGNVANLLLARATARRREMAIRLALGASRGRIVSQMLTESMLLAAGGATLGTALAWWSVRALRAANPDFLPRVDAIQVDTTALLFTLGCAMLTGLIFGIAPALTAVRGNTQESLKEGGRSIAGGARQGLRRALVVAEVALSLILLVGAGLLLKTFWNLTRVNVGFEPRGLMSTQLGLTDERYPKPEDRAQFLRQVLENVRAIPGVESAAGGTGTPLMGWSDTYFTIQGRPPLPGGEKMNAVFRTVTAGYFGTIGSRIVKGREFSQQDTATSPKVVVVNESFARQFLPNEEPLGKVLNIDVGEPFLAEIVGVVTGARQNIAQEPQPEITIFADQQPLWRPTLIIRAAGNAASVATAVRAAVWSVDKEQTLSEFVTMEQRVDRSTAREEFSATLLGIFAGVALALAAIGLYGVIAYSVAQRTHEIGVRIALGAQGRDVLAMILRSGMLLATIGVAAGLAGAWALTRWMQQVLFGVTPTDPATFAGVAALMLAVALLACWIPARRATRVSPLVALRYE